MKTPDFLAKLIFDRLHAASDRSSSGFVAIIGPVSLATTTGSTGASSAFVAALSGAISVVRLFTLDDSTVTEGGGRAARSSRIGRPTSSLATSYPDES